MRENKQQIQPSRDSDALLQACEQEGCPVCLVTLERMERVMDFWQYEGASDMENRQHLRRLRGFCPRHTWQLARLKPVPAAFPLALVYRETLPEILEDIQRDLEQVRADKRAGRVRFWTCLWRKRRGRPANRPAETHFPQCPFCREQAEIERSLVDVLLSMLQFEDTRARFGAATGLCLSHFAQASREEASNAQRAALLECQYACLQRNLGELDELVRKHDYRFLHEPRGDEMISWRRAVELFVGNPGVY